MLNRLLQEYCCHKVDKRIAELIKKKTQQRVQKAAMLAKKEAAGDFSHLKGKKGAEAVSLPKEPTLPVLSPDDDPLAPPSHGRRPSQPLNHQQYWEYENKSEYAASTYGGSAHPNDYHDYPPMPGYYQQQAGNESLYSYDDYYRQAPAGYHDESTANLTQAAAPIAGHQQQHQQQHQHQHYGNYGQHDLKGGQGGGYAM